MRKRREEKRSERSHSFLRPSSAGSPWVSNSPVLHPCDDDDLCAYSPTTRRTCPHHTTVLHSRLTSKRDSLTPNVCTGSLDV